MKKKKTILLIISGSIAAYKALELIRLLIKNSITVVPVLTKSAEEFVTPMSVAVISGNNVYTDLFSLKDEAEIGHINLSRNADLVVIAPASADIISKMALGLANDLASTLLLANDKKTLIVPAMNVKMWENKAVRRNVDILKKDGVIFLGPDSGDLACKEEGYGRMVEPEEILKKVLAILE